MASRDALHVSVEGLVEATLKQPEEVAASEVVCPFSDVVSSSDLTFHP